jgi:hypothetical protein
MGRVLKGVLWLATGIVVWVLNGVLFLAAFAVYLTYFGG